jgi:hypothetical protein
VQGCKRRRANQLGGGGIVVFGQNTRVRAMLEAQQSILWSSMPVFQKRRHGLGGKEAAKEAASKKPAAAGGPDAPSGFKNSGDE